MNTKFLASLPFLAAATALVLLPLSVEFTASLVAVVGLGALFLGDYARELQPVGSETGVMARRSVHALPLAA